MKLIIHSRHASGSSDDFDLARCDVSRWLRTFLANLRFYCLPSLWEKTLGSKFKRPILSESRGFFLEALLKAPKNGLSRRFFLNGKVGKAWQNLNIASLIQSFHERSSYISYCWWFRNPAFTSWCRRYPSIHRVLVPSQVVLPDFWTINSIHIPLTFSSGRNVIFFFLDALHLGKIVGKSEGNQGENLIAGIPKKNLTTPPNSARRKKRSGWWLNHPEKYARQFGNLPQGSGWK